MRSGFASRAPFLPSGRGAETEVREKEGWRGGRRGLGWELARAAHGPPRQPPPPQPNPLSVRASGAARRGASPGASLPSAGLGLTCVRACARASPPVPSWFPQLSRLLLCGGERDHLGFLERLKKPGGGGTEFRVSDGGWGWGEIRKEGSRH